jgi:hypothetical protein
MRYRLIFAPRKKKDAIDFELRLAGLELLERIFLDMTS